MEYLDTNSLLHPNHQGLRKYHNKATALAQMYDEWLEEVEEENMAEVMMIDLSDAFDVVDHMILLQKFQILRLDDTWDRRFVHFHTFIKLRYHAP